MKPAQTHFTAMRDASGDDYRLIGRHSLEFFQGLPDRILTHLRILSGDTGGYAVDRLTHSLQTATWAQRDGQDDEYVVCALLHDIGDTLASANHAQLAATILEPFVSEKNRWIVEQHAIFQGYYFFHHLGMDRDLREQYRGHPWFDRTAEFCALYDSPAFDPRAETLPLEFFEPMVRRVCAVPKRSMYGGEAAG
jgi:predicted HD phosphohydrolase